MIIIDSDYEMDREDLSEGALCHDLEKSTSSPLQMLYTARNLWGEGKNRYLHEKW